MLLAAIGTDEQPYTFVGKPLEPIIMNVPDPFIDEVQINLRSGAQSFLGQAHDGRDVRMRRGCG
jgi:hypothetical protein